VVPLRWTSPGPIGLLASYLASVSAWVDEVIVVDDSPGEIRAEHAARLPAPVRHLAPDPGRRAPNGKVDGIMTGLGAAANELVVIADDDVRWQRPELVRAVGLLDSAELVRPQNYFDPLTWHARWDTARSLLNRVLTGDRRFPVGDFPGTFALRRDFLLALDGYDGEALFENLELMRKIAAAGGRIDTRLDLYVAREPPTLRHFLSQRVRQAYDDWAMPARMTTFLAVMPAFAALLAAGRRRAAAAGLLAPIALAEAGRRRAGGAAFFPRSGSLLAPAWIAERSICAWIALGRGLSGAGVHYGRGRVVLAANPLPQLRRELATPVRPQTRPLAGVGAT
jgi:hypothetical protein